MKEKLKKRRPTKQESKVKGNSSRRIEPVLSLALELQEKVRKGWRSEIPFQGGHGTIRTRERDTHFKRQAKWLTDFDFFADFCSISLSEHSLLSIHSSFLLSILFQVCFQFYWFPSSVLNMSFSIRVFTWIPLTSLSLKFLSSNKMMILIIICFLMMPLVRWEGDFHPTLSNRLSLAVDDALSFLECGVSLEDENHEGS